MACLSESVPCKYFAAGGCHSGAEKGRCREYVGGEGDYVVKTHEKGDCKAWQERWLALPALQLSRAEDVPHPYRWAVVVDVEGARNIVEFPAIVLDMRERCEVMRFHSWIRAPPSEKPPVIDNPESNALDFSEALDAFSAKLAEAGVDAENAVLVCCGDFDANTLRQHCTDHCIAPISFFNRWLNLKDMAFQDEARQRPSEDLVRIAQGLDGMNRLADYFSVPGIDDLDLHHLGMYDTLKIAKMFIHLVEMRGCLLKPTAQWTQSRTEWTGLRIREFWDQKEPVDDGVTGAIRELDGLAASDFNIAARRMLMHLNREGYMEKTLHFVSDLAHRKTQEEDGWAVERWWLEHFLKKSCERYGIAVADDKKGGKGWKGGRSGKGGKGKGKAKRS